MTLTMRILGCGSSGGVPRVGQGWGDCDPAEPRNRRRRCSILLRKRGNGGETALLVDASPDLREQLLDADATRLDATLLTHPHADHMNGIDDVRPIVIHMRRRMPIYMDEATSAAARRSFGYVFETTPGSLYVPIADDRRLHHGRPQTFEGPGGSFDVTPFRLVHGEIDALGLRVGTAAYTPDVSAIPPESLAHLEGLDLWVIDALRRTPHPTHFSLDDALGWIERMGPKRAVLTNMHTDLDYATLKRELPDNVEPAFDGMTLEVGQEIA
ncbi:MAG: MBL fold metallo-hydrolase [Hyphomicrobiales bacterium]|nr:MBL fold metallo-hydrolase [Hyphomicrobiales bacterium]